MVSIDAVGAVDVAVNAAVAYVLLDRTAAVVLFNFFTAALADTFFTTFTDGFGSANEISLAEATAGEIRAITANRAVKVIFFIFSFQTLVFPRSLRVRRICEHFCYKKSQFS